MTQACHQTKFRWTESLTCRFIQLRKENGKLFTGRKYSAQAGWEYILQHMREEFPIIMADVHYRVLKKKWSNLLQQYKELKNPVHGDRNNANDVSWPFYNAIDEVLGEGRRTPNNDEFIDPHEFLCVSVTPEEPPSPVRPLPAELHPEVEYGREPPLLKLQKLRSSDDDCEVEIQRISRAHERARHVGKGQATRKRDSRSALISRLPRATDLLIEDVTSHSIRSKESSKYQRGSTVDIVRDKSQTSMAHNADKERPRKSRRTRAPCSEDHESRIDRRIEQMFEYAKRRDEENKSILVRIMHAVEIIANKL
ncbi:hypothetical protein KM043_016791 [Ampulex compressa]|nr:hypothetical protein KM043_016791 [Ampulex compressa]